MVKFYKVSADGRTCAFTSDERAKLINMHVIGISRVIERLIRSTVEQAIPNNEANIDVSTSFDITDAFYMSEFASVLHPTINTIQHKAANIRIALSFGSEYISIYSGKNTDEEVESSAIEDDCDVDVGVSTIPNDITISCYPVIEYGMVLSNITQKPGEIHSKMSYVIPDASKDLRRWIYPHIYRIYEMIFDVISVEITANEYAEMSESTSEFTKFYSNKEY